jgi:hypothetical protein
MPGRTPWTMLLRLQSLGLLYPKLLQELKEDVLEDDRTQQ